MQNQVNITPITLFAQLLRSAELNQSKEIKISIQQARLLNLALIEMLDKVNQNYEDLIDELRKSSDTDVISVSMDGGNFEE